MQTEENTSWVRVGAIRVGDRIRVPGFSSWSGWASREDAERSEQPFRAWWQWSRAGRGTSRTRFVRAPGGPSGSGLSQTLSQKPLFQPDRTRPYLA